MSTFTATAYPVREENEAIAIVRTAYSATKCFELTSDGVVSITLLDGPLPSILEAAKNHPGYMVLNADDIAALKRLMA